jgi:hypothetical protein
VAADRPPRLSNNGLADPTLANFSVAHDQADVIPLILQAQ